MEEEHISSEALPGEKDIISPDGKETGSKGLVDVLNTELGKEFKDEESAFKYLKDNDSYVGKARNYNPLIEKLENKYGSQEKLIQQLNSMTEEQQQAGEQPQAVEPKDDGLVNEVQALKQELHESNFYRDNPDFKPYQGVIKDLGGPDAVMADETKKGYVEKLKTLDEMENSKSVLQSNPRLGAVVDKQQKAREQLNIAKKAAQSGDSHAAQSAETAARQAAVGSVLDAYER